MFAKTIDELQEFPAWCNTSMPPKPFKAVSLPPETMEELYRVRERLVVHGLRQLPAHLQPKDGRITLGEIIRLGIRLLEKEMKK